MTASVRVGDLPKISSIFLASSTFKPIRWSFKTFSTSLSDIFENSSCSVIISKCLSAQVLKCSSADPALRTLKKHNHYKGMVKSVEEEIFKNKIFMVSASHEAPYKLLDPEIPESHPFLHLFFHLQV